MRLKTRKNILAIAVWLVLTPAAVAASPDDPERAELKQQIESLKRDHEERIRDLEQRVEQPTQTAAEEVRSESAYRRFQQAFNPMLSVILQGRAAYLEGEAGERPIPGFLVGGEAGRGPRGLALGESELVLSANVDDQLYGFFNLSFDQDEIGIEEAYLSTLALPLGFAVKAGQFLSAIGHQNDRHSHSWDFVDQPLVYEAMLGGGLADPGAQLRWIAPSDLYLEIGGEVLRGDAFPSADARHRGFGSATGFAKLGGDVDESHSWKLGLAYLRGESKGRESDGANGATLSFDGSSDIVIADFVWKWAPEGNFRARYLALQTEYLHRRERGTLSDSVSMSSGRHRGEQHGFYVQGVYQFMPRWRVGTRYGQLWSQNSVRGLPASVIDQDGDSPRRVSAMLDFSNSEFSRLRLQYSFESGGLGDDSLVFLQFIISLGAHGAHAF